MEQTAEEKQLFECIKVIIRQCVAGDSDLIEVAAICFKDNDAISMSQRRRIRKDLKDGLVGEATESLIDSVYRHDVNLWKDNLLATLSDPDFPGDLRMTTLLSRLLTAKQISPNALYLIHSWRKILALQSEIAEIIRSSWPDDQELFSPSDQHRVLGLILKCHIEEETEETGKFISSLKDLISNKFKQEKEATVMRRSDEKLARKSSATAVAANQQTGLLSMDKKQIVEILTCPICLDRFKQPKQLPCQHTFCLRPCLQGLAENHRVQCPECRASHRLPPNGVQGFPNNLIVGKLLEVPTQEDFKINAPCQDCKKNNVEVGCHHCDKILCRYCLKNHSQILSQELQQTLSQVRIIVPKVSQRISEINQHEGAIKQNTKTVKADLKRWRQRCISEIDAQTRKCLNEVDAFASEELRPFEPEKEKLLAITSVINSFCGSAEKEISMLSKNAISPFSLRDHQKEVINLTKQGKDHSKMEENIAFGKKCPVERHVKFCGNEGQSVVAAISNFSGVQRLPRG